MNEYRPHAHHTAEDTDLTSNSLWKPLTSDPTSAVTVCAVDGTVLYINPQALFVAFGKQVDPEDIIGQNLRDVGVASEWVEERLELYRTICKTQKSVLYRSVRNGKQLLSWMSPIIVEDEDDPDRVLVITRPVSSSDESAYLLVQGDYEIINSKTIALGKLDVLTPREIEVLALLGQGMAIKEIAKALFRSAKTIENHREAIGRKLHKSRGVDLACIAHVAGLRVDDAQRERIDFDDKMSL